MSTQDRVAQHSEPTIKSRKAHLVALAKLEALMLQFPEDDCTPNEEIVVLGMAIEAYEKRTFIF